MFQNTTNKTLITKTKELVANERLLSAELIRHLSEVDERKLYADEGYPSMFSFLVGGLKYSEPAAARRLSAARLSLQYPQVLCMIENGDLHLTGLHLISPHVTSENGDRLLRACIGKSKRAIEELLVSEVGRTRPIRETVKLVSPVITTSEKESPSTTQHSSQSRFSFEAPSDPVSQPAPKPSADVLISVTLDKESFEKLKRAQSLAGAENMADIVKQAIDLFLTQKDPAIKLAKTPRSSCQARRLVCADAAAPCRATVNGEPEKKNNNQAIPIAEKRAAIKRDGWQCSFINEQTGKRCCETEKLEFDHMIPRAMRGSNHHSNLRLRCKAHNLLAARQIFGTEFMKEKIKHARRSASI